MPSFFEQPLQDFNEDQSVLMVNDGGTDSHQPSQYNAVPPSVSTDAGTSSQGKDSKMSRAMEESVLQQDFYGREKMHYMASQAMCKHNYDCLHDIHLELQDRMRHPIMFLTEIMGDVMYLNQVLRQPDARQFVEAVIKDVNGYVNSDHWILIPCRAVPEDAEIIPSVWAMQHKHNLTTGTITKLKARLNLHSGEQEFGRNYYNT
jgi:hypothetical protein